ncbi:hypothetical protein [Lactococcus garvieae]|uniref:hypothetical protein n=1 Tax=Lactococcus garvieae TaxID=1363 RepID=UPI003132ACBC
MRAPIRLAKFGNGPVSVDKWTTSASERAKACGVPELFTAVLSALTASNRVASHSAGNQRSPSQGADAPSEMLGTTLLV